MARLKELSAAYADEDKCIPVEYCTPTGGVIRGSVQRVLNADQCVIVLPNLTTVTEPVDTTRFAGAGSPSVWCLTRSAHAMHAALEKPEYSPMAAKCQELLPLLWKNFGNYFDAKFALFRSWPGKDLIDHVGFIQLDESRAGFVVFSSDRPAEYWAMLPPDVELSYFE